MMLSVRDALGGSDGLWQGKIPWGPCELCVPSKQPKLHWHPRRASTLLVSWCILNNFEMSCQEVKIHCKYTFRAQGKKEALAFILDIPTCQVLDVKGGYIDQSRQFRKTMMIFFIGSLTCPTGVRSSFLAAVNQTHRRCGLMVIGGKTRGGEHRSRVSSTSSESLSDGQMTCGCSFQESLSTEKGMA